MRYRAILVVMQNSDGKKETENMASKVERKRKKKWIIINFHITDHRDASQKIADESSTRIRFVFLELKKKGLSRNVLRERMHIWNILDGRRFSILGQFSNFLAKFRKSFFFGSRFKQKFRNKTKKTTFVYHPSHHVSSCRAQPPLCNQHNMANMAED